MTRVYGHAVVRGWPVQIYGGMQLHNLDTQMAAFPREISNALLNALHVKMFHHKPIEWYYNNQLVYKINTIQKKRI